ncbi:peptidoglycan DD-metalloendopeptidase family protein [Exiguobacterium sp. s193]|uniref:murein hydrolase activator EnvC family protein n=1 Tax=Exiguobacterium sp. s193 TaxID=2751207 RepID=UPI00203709BD|nr:peptidoglycan DD-metalloendopeptidase family protein [Exiguobacterium sp. s193]
MTLTLLTTPLVSPVSAATSYKEKQQQNEQKQSRQKEALGEKEQQVSKAQQKVYAIDQQINGLTLQVVENEQKIDDNERQLAKLKQKITALQKKIKKQEKMLGDRLAVRQAKSDKDPLLEAVFGAEDIGDMISRFNAFNTIAESDASLLKDYETSKQELADAKQELEDTRTALIHDRKVLKKKQRELNAEKNKRTDLLKRLKKQKRSIESNILSLKEAASQLKAQEVAAKAAALAAKKQAAAQSAQPASVSKASTKVISKATGKFIKPASGSISQGMGAASGNNGYAYHNGTDFAGPVNSAIVASAAGTVIQASAGGPYGNHVYIAHNIGGKTYTTVYAHMNALTVKQGQAVKQGQQIGKLGSTGNSTGPHLHFEIHAGGYQYNANGRTNELDPQSFF